MIPYYIKFERDASLYFDEAIFLSNVDKSNYNSDVPLLYWSGKLHLFPVQIIQWGLYKFNLGLAGDDGTLASAIQIGEYLVANEENGFWDMKIERTEYNLAPPWPSAMAQGEGISLLIRLYQKTKRTEFLETAKNAFKILEITQANGGVLSNFPDGKTGLEEYPSKDPSLVLNGMIFAIFGVYDYAKFVDESKMSFLNALLDGLSANIHRYDSMCWSKYDLYHGGKTSSVVYHNLHCEQLQALIELDSTHRETWMKYYVKWKTKSELKICRLIRNGNRVMEKIFSRR